MSVKAKKIIDLIELIAPENLQAEWDNSGLQIGDIKNEIHGILLCIDITDKAVDFAMKNNLNLILSHHPLFFSEIKSIDFSTYKGNLIKKIIDNDLFIYSAHTNLDASEIGVNSELAKRLELEDVKRFSDYFEEEEIGVMGNFSEETLDNLVKKLTKEITKKNFVKVYGRPKEKIEKVAIIGGSGSFGINFAKSIGADVLITGDIKHHDGQMAYEKDLILIDIGHFYSELPVLFMVKDYLDENLKGLAIEIFQEPIYFIE